MATIQKIRQRLTDGSYTFDVKVAIDEFHVTFPCFTANDADHFVDTLAAAIRLHTTEPAEERDQLETEA